MKYPPLYKVLSNELTLIMKSLKVVKNVKATNIVRYYESVFGVSLMSFCFIFNFFIKFFVLQSSLELLFLMPVFL